MTMRKPWIDFSSRVGFEDTSRESGAERADGPISVGIGLEAFLLDGG